MVRDFVLVAARECGIPEGDWGSSMPSWLKIKQWLFDELSAKELAMVTKASLIKSILQECAFMSVDRDLVVIQEFMKRIFTKGDIRSAEEAREVLMGDEIPYKSIQFLSHEKTIRQLLDIILTHMEFEEKKVTIFMSYASDDSSYFHIRDLAEGLEVISAIRKAMYWERDAGANMIQYMEKNIPTCDFFLLFCSERAKKSQLVTKEWHTAIEMNRRIIPIFTDVNHIPALLRADNGIPFNVEAVSDLPSQIYKRMIKILAEEAETKANKRDTDDL